MICPGVTFFRVAILISSWSRLRGADEGGWPRFRDKSKLKPAQRTRELTVDGLRNLGL